jgi:hypothetical protein
MLSLFQDIHSIIQWCSSHQIFLSICSKSSNSDYAQQILTAFGLWSSFSYPQIYYSSRKSLHFRNLKSCCQQFQYSEFLFFDDEIKNIETCQGIGVKCHLVNKVTGLTWGNFLKGFQNFLYESYTTLQLPSSSMQLSLNQTHGYGSYQEQQQEQDDESRLFLPIPFSSSSLPSSTCSSSFPSPSSREDTSSPIDVCTCPWSSDSMDEVHQHKNKNDDDDEEEDNKTKMTTTFPLVYPSSSYRRVGTMI